MKGLKKFLISTNLSSEMAMLSLGEKWGRERAFAWYIWLLSAMRNQPGNVIHNRPKLISIITSIPEQELTAFISDLLDIGLLTLDRNQNLVSDELCTSCKGYDEKCEINRQNRLGTKKILKAEQGQELKTSLESLDKDSNESLRKPLTNANIIISTNISTSKDIIKGECEGEKKKEPQKAKTPKADPHEGKDRMGEFGTVWLSPEEQQKLLQRCSGNKAMFNRVVEKMDTWEGLKKRKDHYRVAISWVIAAVQKESGFTKTKHQRDMEALDALAAECGDSSGDPLDFLDSDQPDLNTFDAIFKEI